MNSRALRRLAGDHAALHADLPPNYFFPPNNAAASTDDLTELDVLLAGPTHTPFAAGVWRLHLNIPTTYPQQPPTANFRTPIFHPNVDPQTGGVCVETLKRDWDSSYTLRHVLQTISCLLIQPNPDSALNAEAGALIQESYEAFARRAELMTSISAAAPAALRTAAKDAQSRGQDEPEAEEMLPRRRRTIAQARAKAAAAAARNTSPAPSNKRVQAAGASAHSQPFVFQAGHDDVFSRTTPPPRSQRDAESSRTMTDDDTMTDADQENEQCRSPKKSATPITATPRRPQGAAVPLGELIMEEAEADQEFDTSEEMEPEYPPSPRKSPSKSPPKRRQNGMLNVTYRAESSRDAALRGRNITPLNNIDKPLAEDSPFAATFSLSPRKIRSNPFETPGSTAHQISRSLFGKATALDDSDVSVFGHLQSIKAVDRESAERSKRTARDAELWDLCGHDIRRWNRGDFDGQPIKMKAPRW